MLHSKEIRICMDIGNKKHHVAIGLSSGELLDKFDLCHSPTPILSFFQKIKNYEEQYNLPVTVAMEGYNGYARPIDKLVLSKGYRLLSVNETGSGLYNCTFHAVTVLILLLPISVINC